MVHGVVSGRSVPFGLAFPRKAMDVTSDAGPAGLCRATFGRVLSFSRSGRLSLLGHAHAFGEIRGAAGLVDRFFGGDFSDVVEIQQVLVEKLHAELFAGLDGRVDAEGFVFADEVGNGGGIEHEFVGGDHAFDIDPGQEGLGEHGEHRA